MSKQLPFSLEAEMSVIGSILLENESFYKLDLEPDDFYHFRHKKIFAAIKELVALGQGVDLVTVSEKLKDNGVLDKCGGSVYLAEIVDYVPTAANVTYYAGIIQVKSKTRQVIAAAQSVLQEAEQETDPDVLVANVFSQFQSIGQANGNLFSATDNQIEEYKSYINSADKGSFFTGYLSLDANINGGKGVAKGEILTIAGPSGTFKTALKQNMLLNYCMKSRMKAVSFEFEMSIPQVLQRTIQISMEEVTYFIDSGFAGKKTGYIENTRSELKRIGADNLIICDRPALTIEQVEHYTRIAMAEHGNIGVIAIDYLGLMSAVGMKSEYERISYCAEQAKNMAKRLKLPVVILTQVNRSSVINGEMEAWSAKGSGAIEASADYMIGIQKNENKDIIIKLLKNRNGEGNLKFKAELDAKYLKFRDLTPYDEIAQKNVKRGIDRMKALNKEQIPEYEPF